MTSLNRPLDPHERDRLERAIHALETRRSLLGDEVTDTALASMREKLAGLEAGTRTLRIPQQRKLVTILFSDVSGFTAMSETMDHEIVNDVINSLWSRVDKAIVDQGGRIDKHIGDAVMALYGTPTAHEDDPERAIRSALQIQSEIQEWKQEQSEKFPAYRSQIQNIQLRIGVNTGPALLGTVGTVGEYTAIGDTVNLAQRLEAAAPKGGILISNDTHQHVRGIFEVTALDPIMVKGKREPIQVYTVNGIKPRSFRDTTRGLEGVETRTIGREAELEQMKTVFGKMASERATHLISLSAEAGIGKSRVLFEFGKWLDTQEPPVRLFKGRAGQETSKIPYSLLRGILSSAYEIKENDRAAAARRKLERGILHSTGNAESASLYAPFIGHLIGFDYSANPHIKGILGDAKQVRDLAFHYASQLVADMAQSQPVVVLLEDIHWADPDSLDFFEYLMYKRPDVPLLIVGLMRSTLFEQRPEWGTGPVRALTLNLLPLSEADSRRLVLEILQKVPKVPEALINLIVKKVEGSPFYMEELIKVLIEGGVILRGPEQWSVELERLSDLKVPATLTGLLQARLDGLQQDARETLQQASVVGRVFWTDIVEHMRNPEFQSTESVTTIAERLGTLRAKEMVYRYEESGSREAMEFIFKNQVLHDVTYESVLLRLRPAYHIQAADGLVKIGGERANEYAGRVGEHYERAGEWLKAAEWYMRAGSQARNTFAADSALNYYQKALGFLVEHGGPEQLQQKIEAYLRLGEVLVWQARYSDAIEKYNDALHIAELHSEIPAQVRTLNALATALSYQGDNRASLESATRSAKLAREIGEKSELARALRGEGSARFRLGEVQTALSLAEQAVDIAKDLNDQNELARSLNLLAGAHYVSGRFDEAESRWDQALKIFQELGNRKDAIDLLSNLGVIADGRGDYETAFQRYDNALQIAREIGYKDGEIVFLSNRGGELAELGRYEEAVTDLRQAIGLAGIDGSWVMPLTFNYHANALIGLGRYQEAFYSARQALVLAEEDKTPDSIGLAWRTLGVVASHLGGPVQFSDWDTHQRGDYDAESCFEKSVRIFTEAEIDLERARTLREWARYRHQIGDQANAEKMWQEAREIFTKLGAQREVERTGTLSG